MEGVPVKNLSVRKALSLCRKVLTATNSPTGYCQAGQKSQQARERFGSLASRFVMNACAQTKRKPVLAQLNNKRTLHDCNAIG